MNLNPPSLKHKLYSIYHSHEYGSTNWLLWANVIPQEERVVTALDINFELEKNKYIDIVEIDSIEILELS